MRITDWSSDVCCSDLVKWSRAAPGGASLAVVHRGEHQPTGAVNVTPTSTRHGALVAFPARIRSRRRAPADTSVDPEQLRPGTVPLHQRSGIPSAIGREIGRAHV